VSWGYLLFIGVVVAASLSEASSRHFFRRQIMPQGKVKRLVSDRGFGFVEAGRQDLFFHHSEVKGVAFDDLQEGQMVDFDLGEGRKGPCATSVRPTGQTSAA
jgi:CspA family cold shock protein